MGTRPDLETEASPPRDSSGERLPEAQRPADAETLAMLETPSEQRFVVLNELGRGGMGQVSRLRDRVLLRDVALKSVTSTNEIGGLLDEARITGQLDHPYIVPIHDVARSTDGEKVCFMMKLVEGRTFTDVVESLHGEPWDDRAIEHCLHIITRVCDALAFSHSRGVIHCDVKPENVMVGSYGQVYLMDWGLAVVQAPATGREALAPDTESSGGRDRQSDVSIAGTPEYMAPEQMRGKVREFDTRTDVFGIGGLLYFLLTGHGPNWGPRGAQRLLLPSEVPSPAEHGAWSHLPPELCRIALRALAFDPNERYPSVTDLQNDIEEFLRGGGWFETRIYPAGSTIVSQGDVGVEAFMVVSGDCDVFQESGGGRHHLRRMTAGDVFGEMAILTDASRTATVVAATDVTVKVVTADAFDRELSTRTWAGRFVRAIAERFRDVDGRLAALRGEPPKPSRSG